MEKLVLKKQKYRNNDNMCRVRVSGSVYQQMEDLAEKTNMSVTDVATRLFDFAIKHTEVEE
ncbi:hypothetical protein GCWU000341_02314 [Oribacterium sp. oral taxon 078 str. F0262]|mgnify:FL=1|uniref:hypothetical protein n=1 Tax=Oribacterium sp. oral taxon 078 TaxID=652706 RepID=UPI0001BCBE75|nr:hypothetical protein [Oribacterium sp. oral taxon 078]EFE91206.1 hypothetical protein GCWU000341_02314 [Oribacterium sp. oral taxon 078 str. F0262]